MACFSSVLPARYATSLEALARRGLVSDMACFSSVLPARYATSLEALAYTLDQLVLEEVIAAVLNGRRKLVV